MDAQLLNGVDVLRNSFPNEKSFVEHVVHNILFFDKDIVEQQALTILRQIEQQQAVPVRYNSNELFFLQHETRRTTTSFKNKKEAVRFTKEKENAVFHYDTGIQVYFDSDGNIRNDDTDAIAKSVKDLIKAISIQLYNPKFLMKKELVDTLPKEALDKASQLIKSGGIKFVPKNNISLKK